MSTTSLWAMNTLSQVPQAQHQGTIFHQYPTVMLQCMPVSQKHHHLAGRSQAHSQHNASNSSPVGPAEAASESRQGNRACVLFDGPLAAGAGWLETNINNSLR